MSSTLRKQQIEEIKNYNQNINRQVLAKAHSQIALWELERPELTPITSEFTSTIDAETENLKVLLNEKLSLLDKVIEQESITEKEFKSITKYSDVVVKYNELISPLLKARFDYKYKSLAKNATITIKQEIVGINIGFKKLLENISNFGVANVKIYIESFTVYDFINYQIDTENYQLITVNVLKSRIPQILSKLPEDVQLLYVKSQKMYEPLRASVRKEEDGGTIQEKLKDAYKRLNKAEEEDNGKEYQQIIKEIQVLKIQLEGTKEKPVFEEGQLEQQSPQLKKTYSEVASKKPEIWSEILEGNDEEIREALRTYPKTTLKNKIISGLKKELKEAQSPKIRNDISRKVRLAEQVYDEVLERSPVKPRGKPPVYEGTEQYEKE